MTIKLYGLPVSGHTHRVVLLLNMLQLPYEFIEAGANVRRSEAFLKLNPLGQIPVLIDGDLVLGDSNAILTYLSTRYAAKSHWYPTEAVAIAQVQRWLSIAAGEVRYGPASARMTALWSMPGEVDPTLAEKIATRLFTMMEGHLSQHQWLATQNVTIADLACYSYIAHASEGRLSLAAYPAIRAWLQRVESLPHFRAMPTTPLPAASVTAAS